MRKLPNEEKAKLRAKIEEARAERIHRIKELAAEEEQWSPKSLLGLYSSSCPQCGRKRALIGTGRTKVEYRKVYDEYRCKHCQYSDWRIRPPSFIDDL